MAQITINEISKNYTYSSGNSSFCSVALPITASWGPAFEDPASLGISLETMLETTAFQHFASTQDGLELFTTTYRGPAANYRSAKDYSYQIAVTLLTAGYDLDVCRVCSGTHASAKFNATIGTGETTTGSLTVKAKYPGSFGNNLIATLKKVQGRNYWNLISYIVDSNGTTTAVENMIFVFDIENSTDTIPHIDEIQSSFFTLVVDGIETDNDVAFDVDQVSLDGGSDRLADGTAQEMMADAISLATTRYGFVPDSDPTDYLAALNNIKSSNPSVSKASIIRYMEWNYNAAYQVLGILTDRLAYSAKRLILPGWDDQNFKFLTGETVARIGAISPLHARMADVSYQARCMTALIDIPQSLERSGVYNDSTIITQEGYAQKIANYLPSTFQTDGLFSTHYALIAPWCQYKYVGTSRNNPAPPGFLTLMIQIAMIKNQSLQYEWAQPTTRKHNLTIGAPDFIVPNKLLDEWQSGEGAGINIITNIPDMGMTFWGNDTSFNNPPATYQALRNLSSRYLMNAMKDISYRAGVAITFQYNNEEAYSKFYAACAPLADTMLSVGAITSYTIEMNKDLNSLDSINLNSCIGKIQLFVQGVLNAIVVDLIALPAGTENA